MVIVLVFVDVAVAVCEAVNVGRGIGGSVLASVPVAVAPCVEALESPAAPPPWPQPARDAPMASAAKRFIVVPLPVASNLGVPLAFQSLIGVIAKLL